MKNLRVSIVQLNCGENKENNVAKAVTWVKRAFTEGAEFVVLPEVFTYRGTPLGALASGESVPGSTTNALAALCQTSGGWVLAGSLCETIPGEKKVFNTSVLLGPDGEVKARYRKIHLFDAEVKGRKIQESASYKAGCDVEITELNGKKLGLSICYDLRFPELYREFAKQNVEMIVIPSAFTKTTGEAHWEVLARARAIENSAFVIAANQVGASESSVPAYGNSMIIDPWGTILARASSDEEEIISATLDFSSQEEMRRVLPCLTHRKLY